MKDAPPRWRDLHPGDMVIERAATVPALKQAAELLRPDGYRFTVESFGDACLVTCLASPRPLIGNRP